MCGRSWLPPLKDRALSEILKNIIFDASTKKMKVTMHKA